MSVDLAAVLLGAAVGGVGSVAVPPLIALLPEPDPEPEPDDRDEADAAADAALTADPAPDKELYADIAALPGLTLRCVVAGLLVGGFLGAVIGMAPVLLIWLPLVPVGLALALIDWRTHLLPTRLVLPATIFAMLVGTALTVTAGDTASLRRALVGMIITRTFFWVLWFIRSAGMGFGDVRLSALLGFLLALHGWGELLVGMYVAFLAFAVPGLLLAVVRRDRQLLKQAHPFGPFLLAGTLVGLAWDAWVM